MKTIKMFILTFFLLTTHLMAQSNRFDKHTSPNYNMDWYVPNNSASSREGCYLIYQKLNEIIKSMALVSGSDKFKEYYEPKGLWIENRFSNSDWLFSAKWIFAEGIFQSSFLEITLLNGNKYYYDDVPKQTFIDWFYSSSAGEYYHNKIKQYTLNRYIPENCK